MNFKKYFQGWNMTRIFRLVLGIVIVTQGIISQEWIFTLLGAAFTLMPMFNAGCFANGTCETPNRKTDTTVAQKDVEFKEIK